MSNTQGAELTIRELLQKRDVNDGDTQRADGRIQAAGMDSMGQSIGRAASALGDIDDRNAMYVA